MSLYFHFSPECWRSTQDGRRYTGQWDVYEDTPDGLGVLQMDASRFYIGQLAQGKRSGRGLVVNHVHREEEEEYYQRGSYEEVMATAEFDSCGRVIHVEPVGRMVKSTKTVDYWEIEQNGLWSEDQFMEETDQTLLYSDAWKEARISKTTYIHKNQDNSQDDYTFGSWSGSLESLKGHIPYHIDAFVTPFDATRLLVCTDYGEVLVLGVGEEVFIRPCETPEAKKETSYHLIFNPDFKVNIEMIMREWGETPPPMAKEQLYLRTLSCCQFRLGAVWIHIPLAGYIAAIRQQRPKIPVTQRHDGAYTVTLPHDEWTLWEGDECIHLFSARAKGELRIQKRGREDVAKFAAESEAVWKYIEKLKIKN